MNYKENINELIKLGNASLTENYVNASEEGWWTDYLDGDKYRTWLNKTKLFVAKYLKGHVYEKNIIQITNGVDGNIEDAKQLLSMLQILAEEEEDVDNSGSVNKKKTMVKNNKVFIVHGHDNEAVQTVARALERDGFEPIILREQPDNGNTIIANLKL